MVEGKMLEKKVKTLYRENRIVEEIKEYKEEGYIYLRTNRYSVNLPIEYCNKEEFKKLKVGDSVIEIVADNMVFSIYRDRAYAFLLYNNPNNSDLAIFAYDHDLIEIIDR